MIKEKSCLHAHEQIVALSFLLCPVLVDHLDFFFLNQELMQHGVAAIPD